MYTSPVWRYKPLPDPDSVDALRQSLKVHPIVCALLVQRGVLDYEQAKQYFRPDPTHLHDPFLMLGMESAVARIGLAVNRGERIMVYGDYDVDGTTSVALVATFLQHVHPNIICYIPDRYSEGYGVSEKGIRRAAELGVGLIISLDCGIKAVSMVRLARSLGIDFIVCDHHEPDALLPEAVAVLDPKQPGCTYPFKELSGCGVGFKLLQALCLRFHWSPEKYWQSVELVAISIGADIVPMTGENRVLSFLGIKKLNENPLPGVKALCEVAGLKIGHIRNHQVVFGLAPRINAAGRISHANAALDLLMAADEASASEYAQALQGHNVDRKELDSDITQEALEAIRLQPDFENLRSTVLYNEHWSKGVIGIVASRCIENFYRPTVILTKSHQIASGSARSIDGFDLYHAIECCSDTLIQFGGHKHAAGLSLEIENIPKFAAKFEEVVRRLTTPDMFYPKLNIDLQIALGDIHMKWYDILVQMEPFGPGNMTPVFSSQGLSISDAKLVGSHHLRCTLVDASGARFDAIAFRMGHLLEQLPNHTKVDVVYTLEKNEFRGNITLQLNLRDIRPTNPS